MKGLCSIWLPVLGILVMPMCSYAQEDELDVEKSAEVFLEEYSDTFQEKFFEALKQKGIENYDRAINLFLECKQLDADNSVLDYELAKAHMANKDFIQAQEYALEALNAEPTNYWYLDVLVAVAQKQGGSLDTMLSEMPYQTEKLRQNLALIYFQRRKYEKSLNVLRELGKTDFSRELSAKINDSIKQEESKSKRTSVSVVNTNALDPLQSYKMRVQGLMASNNLALLENLATEALDSYPSQPFFYYAKGYALNRKGKPRLAIEELEAALDLILDDISLANKLYGELSQAYGALNNTSKANMYLRKIKPGF